MRKRGYVVFGAIVLAAVLLLLLLPKQEPQPLPAAAAAADSLRQPQPDHSSTRSYRRNDYHRSYRHASARPTGQDSSASRPATAENPSAPVRTAAPARARRTHVDLNGGDTLDWQQLYGIGPVFARRIVRYRTLLGGFVCKEQLLEVYGMDSARYRDIAPYIDINPSAVQQLDINSASIDQLKRHPYLDYYQAKAIVRLREQEGAYQSVDDIRRVPVIDQETYNKILPYITCNSQQNR